MLATPGNVCVVVARMLPTTFLLFLVFVVGFVC